MLEPGPAYPAARSAAGPLEAYFARLVAGASARGEHELAPVPPARVIETIIDAAFWASLRREEGNSPRISLAYLAPAVAGAPLRFARPLPLDAAALTRLAPAVVQPGIHLGVWEEEGGGDLRVWGATRGIPGATFVLEVVQPGLLVVKHRRAQPFGKFGNVAVLEGDRVRLVDEAAASLPDCPELLASLLGFNTPAGWGDSVNILVQVAAAMRSHARGGTLLVVPSGSASWRESVLQPIAYEVAPRFAELAILAQAAAESTTTPPAETPAAGPSAANAEIDPDGPARRDALQTAVETIAGLTAVDGATIISDRFELLGFGAKIHRRDHAPSVETVTVTEPVIGDAPSLLHVGDLGGTRHLSAAQFIHDQHDALALVASQDGRFTVLAWSPCEDSVHAHRVEVLLM